MKEIKDLSLDDFVENEYVCLLFYIEGSIMCQNMIDFLSELQINFSNVKIGKVSIEENAESVIEFKIYSVPTLILLKDGKIVEKIEKYLNKKELQVKLNYLRK